MIQEEASMPADDHPDGSASSRSETIGLIFVHGIGEQRRFEHLDGELRYVIQALRSLPNVSSVSVDIAPSGGAAFHAEQDSWDAGPEPSVNVYVNWRDAKGPRKTQMGVHEVWWADVNEVYSLAKQFRFWLWGLAIWNHPGKPGSVRDDADYSWPPAESRRRAIYDRFRLYLVGFFFALLGFSVGIITFVANRVFNWETPDVLKVITNYLSAVKLYNQRRRFGPGLWWECDDFLDTIDEPPRVSVRRRMVRAICDVACRDYARWYVLAHSQGTVVAFNGLMAPSYVWPGYLNLDRWSYLVKEHKAGPMRAGAHPPGPHVQPRRPEWVTPEDIAYRKRIFARFKGFLTYGSPLEKFAAIWPERIAISREPAFRPDVPWINLYDPIDPVSGRLCAFQRQPIACCPRPINVGYSASWWLLLAHLKYLTHRPKRPADAARATAIWLLTDDPGGFSAGPRGMRPGSWFDAGSQIERSRRLIAWITWFVAAAVLAALGAIFLQTLLDALVTSWHAFIHEVQKVVGP
jgi:hypothetical protein